jgi:hypothetical protein
MRSMSLADGLSMEGDGPSSMGVVVVEAEAAGRVAAVGTEGGVAPIALGKAGISARGGGALPSSAPRAAETAGTSSRSSMLAAKASGQGGCG